MRYLMIAVVAAVLTAPMIGCHETTETKKNPITGSQTTTHSVDGN